MIETADLFEGRNAEAEGRPPFTKAGRPPPSSSTGECVMARTVWRATSLATRWALLLSVRRKPEIMRANAIGRGRFANHSETKRFHGDGSYPSPIRRAPASDAATASAWGGGFGRLASQVVRQAGIGWQGSNHGALPGWVGIVK